MTQRGRDLGMTMNIQNSPGAFHQMWNEIQSLYKYRYLVSELVQKNIKNRYKRSILGVAWTMINPLLTMLVLTIVFSQLFGDTLVRYPLYLLSGLLLWNFFSQTTVSAIRDLVWSSQLLKRIYIPKGLFATAAVGTGLVNMLLALIPLGIIAILTGARLGWALLFLPVALLIASLFAMGIGLAVSTQAVFFGDVVEMYQILLVAWMYLTPIFYPIEILSPNLRWIIYLNPLYYVLECFRDPIYLNQLPDLRTFFIALFSAIAVVMIGAWIFTRKANEFAYYL